MQYLPFEYLPSVIHILPSDVAKAVYLILFSVYEFIFFAVIASNCAAGTPVGNAEVLQAKAAKVFTDGGIKYTMMATEDGNGWILEGKYKKGGKYVLLFDNKGTESIYDDEVLKVYKCR